MKVLVTGHRGLIGGWITEEMRNRGIDFVGYDIIEGNDIFDTEKLTEAMKDCFSVIHLAAYPSREASNDPAEFERLNHQGSMKVFEAAKRAGIKRFVYCSSGNVYCWGDGLQDDDPPPYDVHHHPDTSKMHPYPKSKIDTERFLELQAGKGIQIFILRPNCLAPTPEPWYTIFKKSTITRERMVRYFINAATDMEIKKPMYEIFDCIEPNPWFPGSIRAQELFDKKSLKEQFLEIARPLIKDLKYFDGHFPRFDWQMDRFIELLNEGKVKSVFDIGTGFPFASGIFSMKQIPVMYGMIDESWTPPNEYCTPKRINVNYRPDDLGTADLVICTECLEHLPSSMVKALNWLCHMVNPGGYMLLSFPLGGTNAQNYDDEGIGDYNTVSHQHYREFTRQTAEEFIKDIPFKIVAEKEIFTAAYGAPIWNVLMEKIE